MMRHDRHVAGRFPDVALETRWLRVFHTLDEGQARPAAAQKALELGRGGVSRVSALTGLSRTTITRGVADLENPSALERMRSGRSRQYGGGRKRLDVADACLKEELRKVLDDSTAGDPTCSLKWLNKSRRTIAEELTRMGHPVSAQTVGRYISEAGFSLQGNFKSYEGKQSVDRDEQFRYINSQVADFMANYDPVISVDTKQRELVGNFKNAGRVYRRKGDPSKVNAYDYRSWADGVALPYGTLDVATNKALVNVGTSYDTSEFAVESIRRWWKMLGQHTYPEGKRLLICADGGGSNGSRRKTWKLQIQKLADELGTPVTVCHYPPGTSKWNKIEHRLFSFISINWRGKPLLDYETIIQLIGSTKTRKGLQVRAMLDTRTYKKGIVVSDDELDDINLHRHKVYPLWNYTIAPHDMPMILEAKVELH